MTISKYFTAFLCLLIAFTSIPVTSAQSEEEEDPFAVLESIIGEFLSDEELDMLDEEEAVEEETAPIQEEESVIEEKEETSTSVTTQPTYTDPATTIQRTMFSASESVVDLLDRFLSSTTTVSTFFPYLADKGNITFLELLHDHLASKSSPRASLESMMEKLEKYTQADLANYGIHKEKMFLVLYYLLDNSSDDEQGSDGFGFIDDTIVYEIFPSKKEGKEIVLFHMNESHMIDNASWHRSDHHFVYGCDKSQCDRIPRLWETGKSYTAKVFIKYTNGESEMKVITVDL